MTETRDTLLDRIGHYLATKLEAQSSGYQPYTPSDPQTLYRTLAPGDVLLVEGNRRISAAIKYLTQSTWSHAAIYVGDALDETDEYGHKKRLIEVNLGTGCTAEPLEKYETYNTRICRAVGLSPDEVKTLVEFSIGQLGIKYDNKNIIDMLRYFLPTPPVPVRWRRRMIQFGSGDPTRAICSTMIAQAYQKIRYPILPEITNAPGRARAVSDYSRREILHIRHHSLFTPRDFDLSPYFQVVKPTLQFGFDHKKLVWGSRQGPETADKKAVETQSAPPAD